MGYLCTHFASSLNVVCMVYSVVVTRYYESLTATYSQIDISIREMRDGWMIRNACRKRNRGLIVVIFLPPPFRSEQSSEECILFFMQKIFFST